MTLEVFKLNRGLGLKNDNVITLTKEICRNNIKKGIETTIFLDLNIIVDITIFMFREKCINEKVCRVVNQFIDIISELDEVVLCPRFALYESKADYIDKNINGFNAFLSEYLPRFSKAYNSIEFIDPKINLKKYYYFMNIVACLYAAKYVKKYYSMLTPIEKFKKYYDLLKNHLAVTNELVDIVSMYGFFEKNNLDLQKKKIVENFFKGGKDLLKKSYNAAHDIMFLEAIKGLDRSFNKNSTIDAWGLTGDDKLRELTKIISLDENNRIPFIELFIDNDNELLLKYMKDCQSYKKSKRDIDILHGRKIPSETEILNKANSLIEILKDLEKTKQDNS